MAAKRPDTGSFTEERYREHMAALERDLMQERIEDQERQLAQLMARLRTAVGDVNPAAASPPPGEQAPAPAASSPPAAEPSAPAQASTPATPYSEAFMHLTLSQGVLVETIARGFSPETLIGARPANVVKMVRRAWAEVSPDPKLPQPSRSTIERYIHDWKAWHTGKPTTQQWVADFLASFDRPRWPSKRKRS